MSCASCFLLFFKDVIQDVKASLTIVHLCALKKYNTGFHLSVPSN